MKRSPALAPLSRDHHVALALALRVRRDGASPADREAFVRFLASETTQHFAVEEEVLLPAVADLLPPSDPDVIRLLDEHAELRRRSAALVAAGDAGDADLRAAGDLLTRHVRFEERVLFPRIEGLAGERRLAELAPRLIGAERP